MRTKLRTIAFGLPIGILLLSGFAAAQNPRSMIGKKAPALMVSNWMNTGGKALSLDKLKGKVVVVDFWAYW